MIKIVVENLKYKYPLADELALNNLSFEVKKGEIIGIIGRNGAGKSTLCQSFVGLVPHFYKGAYGGKVLVDGIEVRNSNVAEMSLKVGIVFQNPFTQITGSKLTVYEEIAFGLENSGLPRKQMIERIDSALDLLGMIHLKNRNPFDLSGGQMQRMAIASIIAMQPDVIILDEPTSQLDPKGSEDVFQAIHNLVEKGMTVLLAEQKMDKIAEYCDRVLLLDKGSLITIDTPEVVFSRGDLQGYGINEPAFTRVCKALNVTKSDTGNYPVTLEDAFQSIGRYCHDQDT